MEWNHYTLRGERTPLEPKPLQTIQTTTTPLYFTTLCKIRGLLLLE